MSDHQSTTAVPGSAAPPSPGPVPGPSGQLVVEVYEVGPRRHIVVGGEIDLDSGPALADALAAALEDSQTGIDLDLSRVGFCDATGLNVLLSLREQALEQDRTLVLRAASPLLIRVLSVTDSLALLAGWPEGEDAQEGEELRTELAHLRRAMETRPVIDMARGLLMATFRLDAEDAWTVLVEVSQHTNIKLHEVARMLLDAGTAEETVDPQVQQEVAAAVGRLTARSAASASERPAEVSSNGSAPEHGAASSNGSAPKHGAAPGQASAPKHGSAPNHGPAPAHQPAPVPGPVPRRVNGSAPSTGSGPGDAAEYTDAPAPPTDNTQPTGAPAPPTDMQPTRAPTRGPRSGATRSGG
ncbi:ANTAR domain-containing protein [Streptomyces indicus]|uniref:Anti-anti-sigma factor n=1 Tax=Streptomyces indicus TaxID=417292 RepID=A0A1G9ASM2_9ACTN|nr:ANTAR domain-containing protein [Streptomyces indicus]SDK30221.1 anti-anti-sigma factor [Streptomyces indicus]